MSARITVDTTPAYDVLVGPGLLARAQEATRAASTCVIVSDANVAPLYRPRLAGLQDAPLVTVPAGEEAKSLGRLGTVLDSFAAHTLDRDSVVVALGGGVVGDLAGLAASLYMRGIDVVQCPTTLLAQVDASVGGKTAVNLRAGKNLVGTFHQPRAVYADTETLTTLDEEEFASGLGEVVKSALIADAELLRLLEERAEDVRRRDAGLLTDVVQRCVRVKADVVAADVRESGRRRVLNLGHTFAHAIEQVAGYGRIPHGTAVGVGLVLALRAAARKDLLQDSALSARIARLLVTLGLHAELGALREAYKTLLPAPALVEALRSDKKGTRGTPLFVLPRALGELTLDVRLEPELLQELFR